jgi:hypothetical protein
MLIRDLPDADSHDKQKLAAEAMLANRLPAA